MKTLKQIKEEYNNKFFDSVDLLPEEVMLETTSKQERRSLMGTSPSFKQMPSMLLFRRITYRKYPGDQTVALYYSATVDKYLSIPFGPGGNLNLSEAVILEGDSNSEFFDRMTKAGVARGMSEPRAKQMASLSAVESGWGKSGMAKKAQNYFGQTGSGPLGHVIGADKQKHRVFASAEDAVQHHVEKWGKYYSDDPKETTSNLVKAGYNTVNPKWSGMIQSIYNKRSTPSQPKAPETTQVAKAPEMPKAPEIGRAHV